MSCVILAVAFLVSSTAGAEETAASNFDDTVPMERGEKSCGGKSIVNSNIFPWFLLLVAIGNRMSTKV